ESANNAVEQETAVRTAILLWNAWLLPEKEQGEILDTMARGMGQSFWEQVRIRADLKRLLQRRQELFGRDRRFVQDVFFQTLEGGRLHFTVAWTDFDRPEFDKPGEAAPS
ncbi:MAG: hypothetical protein NTW86_09425, partial [Candidatus Sumerlaeota bacterium]|nr:hypothetical protein [Candidatus Sumerlaeota bacterium]